MNKIYFCDQWRYAKIGEELKPAFVPHDAMLHQERMVDSLTGSAQAFFPGGSYMYEKVFEAPENWRDQHIEFQFEGVYKNAKVTLNGKEIGGAAYGYIPFFCCADDALRDGENILRVTCENLDQPDSRWYSGAGIYRPVWMWTGAKSHIPPEGVRITTVAIDPATIRVQTTVTEGDVFVEVLDGDKVVASVQGGDVTLPVRDAKLWSEDVPYLYTCRVTLSINGMKEDQSIQTFGIRKITWDNKGLYINGKRTLLRGGCLHHDNGILGAATFDESEYRRVKLLKEAGFNAIRSAHNPASRALIEACDRLGVYLMDESWDMWFHHKNKHDYASVWKQHYLDDLKAMVDRDYNHPSVILYSIGNEVSEPAKDEGLAAAKEMIVYLHQEDPSRPVTGGFNLMIIASAKKGKGVYKEEGGRDDSSDKKMQGMNSTMFNLVTTIVGTGMNKAANGKKADEATSPLLNALDISGYNYASGRYPKEGTLHPDRLVFGSETFPQDIWKNWQMVNSYPWVIGDFMWTAIDYLGEVGLGAWAYTKDGKGFNKPYPWLLADSGAFDILGNPTAEVYLAQVAWGLLKKPAIAVQPVNHPGVKPAKMTWRGTNAIPSWSWKGCERYPAVVEVYADSAMIALELNGKKVGQKRISSGKASFKVKYAAGTLTAIALDASGKEISRNTLISAKDAVVHVTPENENIKVGDVAYFKVRVADARGITESNDDQPVTVSVQGGELLGFGSANPRTEERFDSGVYTTYYGEALAAVRVTEQKVTLMAQRGTESAEAAITVR